jgi:hypothetical protein
MAQSYQDQFPQPANWTQQFVQSLWQPTHQRPISAGQRIVDRVYFMSPAQRNKKIHQYTSKIRDPHLRDVFEQKLMEKMFVLAADSVKHTLLAWKKTVPVQYPDGPDVDWKKYAQEALNVIADEPLALREALLQFVFDQVIPEDEHWLLRSIMSNMFHDQHYPDVDFR